MDLGAHPVHGEGHQPHADIGVEALDGLHQADIAFLDQIGLWQTIAAVTARDLDHKAQMRHDQPARGLQVIIGAEAPRQPLLFFQRQDRRLIDGRDIGLKRTRRQGELQIGQVFHGLSS